jgi:hypothetical protein
LPARARRVIEETFVALEKAFVDHPATLKRPDLRKPPVRVAALVFDDERIGAPGYCRSRVVKSLEEDVAHLNHAIGRTLYVMSEPSDSDLLIVIGGPQSVPNLKIDAKAEAIFRAGERRLTVPHREHWQSYLPPDVEPYEAAALYYREDNGELLYGLISRSWSTITKECAGRFADDLARALTTDVNRSLPTDFGAPQSWYPAASAIELCFLAMKPDAATDDRVACVERVVELLKRRD